MIDWGTGEYERTAEALAPTAQVAVAALRPQRTERVLDVACGTGNAAALVADAGSEVVGIDSADRLVDVARARVPTGTFLSADAADLPFTDDYFDAAVSVFGIIFAAPEAAAELSRVVRPGGRMVITAWVPEGALSEAVRLVRSVVPRPPDDAAAPTAWHEAAVLARLFGRPVRVERREVTFTAPSAASWWDDQVQHHPAWIAAGESVASVRDAALAILGSATTEAGKLRLTSPYVVARIDN